MIKEKNINMLEALLKERMAGLLFSENDARSIAEYLAGKSVIAAPVEIGQTVYCAIPPEYNDGEAVVASWRVQGIVYKADGKLYAMDGGLEYYEIDSEDCRLTYADAEEDLKRFEVEALESKDESQST